MLFRCIFSAYDSCFLQTSHVNWPSSAWQRRSSYFDVIRSLKHEMCLREMWLQLLQAGSQQCAPHHRPRMFGHWVTQPSAHTHRSLSFCSYFFSLRLACTPFSPRPRVLGGHMRCSDPTLILPPVLGIIQSSLLGKWKNGQKQPHKQTTQVFLTTARWKFPPHSLSIRFDFIESPTVQILNLCTLHLCFFCISYTLKKPEQQMLIGSAPPEVFRVKSFQNSDRLTSAEEQEILTPCWWDSCYEFLDGGDYDTVISGYVLMISLIVPSSTSVSRAGNKKGGRKICHRWHIWHNVDEPGVKWAMKCVWGGLWDWNGMEMLDRCRDQSLLQLLLQVATACPDTHMAQMLFV